MKQVVLQKPVVDFALASNADPSKYYGVNLCGFKGFICAEKYKSDYYTIRSFDGLTKASGWDEYCSKNLQGLLAELVRDRNEVYEFDDYQDLLEWVLGD